MLRLIAIWGLVMAAGCGDDAAPRSDAGSDAGRDAGGDAGRSDAGSCPTPCTALQLCCPGPVGPFCAENEVDPENCGLCGFRCAEGRGTHCTGGWCVCGISDMGCLGTRNSTCCPPRVDGGMAYCANLYTHADDCGTCGRRCDERASDACSGGECVCGDARTGCTGELDDLCCPGAAGIGGCVDGITDPRNCGGCGISCSGIQRCIGGLCVSRDAGT